MTLVFTLDALHALNCYDGRSCSFISLGPIIDLPSLFCLWPSQHSYLNYKKSRRHKRRNTFYISHQPPLELPLRFPLALHITFALRYENYSEVSFPIPHGLGELGQRLCSWQKYDKTVASCCNLALAFSLNLFQ